MQKQVKFRMQANFSDRINAFKDKISMKQLK